ncbi:hypothetical protein AUP40_21360 [Thalassospira xiamenensis]|uniref:Uncharacterized protein n=2 Tax=Thalassospira xiamenensis TaxID=220697 RepID=A0ABR5XYX8_9PROT|nr:hypothetical protein AUP40_21360 [Thalassospira xiamenensis]KZD04132.1 hypothetical protein AUP45_21665 [Thalassospira xiamenensis]
MAHLIARVHRVCCDRWLLPVIVKSYVRQFLQKTCRAAQQEQFQIRENRMTNELPKHLEHLAPDEVRTGEITNPKAVEKIAGRLKKASSKTGDISFHASDV